MSKRKTEDGRQKPEGRGRKAVWLAVAVVCCLSFAVLAQSGRKPQGQPGQQPPSEKPVARIETREVVLPLRAYDAEGHFVSDLEPKDVVVFEDEEPRPVSYLRHEPANIVLVLDLNNEIGTFKNGPSRWTPREDPDAPKTDWKPQEPLWKPRADYSVLARPATREFAENFVAKLSPADSVAIIQYSDKVQLIQDWTNSREQALQALRSKYRIGLKGRLYDALALAADKLESRKTGRRLVVLISDGVDSTSKAQRRQAVTALARAQATVFVVGWAEVMREEVLIAMGLLNQERKPGIELMGGVGKRLEELQRYLRIVDGKTWELKDLAETSGGELLLPKSFDELTASPKTLTQEIGAQYSLAFITERKPSLEDLRDLKVTGARPGLTVRTRRSYYVGDDAR